MMEACRLLRGLKLAALRHAREGQFGGHDPVTCGRLTSMLGLSFFETIALIDRRKGRRSVWSDVS